MMREETDIQLVSPESATNGEEPSTKKLERNSKRHFRSAPGAISEYNRNFDNP